MHPVASSDSVTNSHARARKLLSSFMYMFNVALLTLKAIDERRFVLRSHPSLVTVANLLAASRRTFIRFEGYTTILTSIF